VIRVVGVCRPLMLGLSTPIPLPIPLVSLYQALPKKTRAKRSPFQDLAGKAA
jgi:hypothetical protein